MLVNPDDPRILKKTIGHNTAVRRRMLGLTQEDLGEMIGYDRRWVSYLERGKGSVKLEFLPKLAIALNLKEPLVLIEDKAFDRLD